MAYTADDFKDKKNPKYKQLLQQVASEFKVAHDTMSPLREVWKRRIRLYVNQKYNNNLVGEPLLFSTFNTLQAAYWQDRLEVLWKARNDGDEEKAKKLTNLAKNDYYVMQKDLVDYDRLWDTLFFSFGIVFTPSFDTKNQVPINYVLDPMTFYFDPNCSTLTPRPGQRGGRFFGYQELEAVSSLKKEAKQNGMVPSVDAQMPIDNGTGQTADIAEAMRLRAESRGLTFQGIDKVVGSNAMQVVTKWFTYIDDDIYQIKIAGNLLTSNDGALDGEDPLLDACDFIKVEKMDWDFFPLTEYRCYPVPHQFVGVSVPDLIEDKQTTVSEFLNLTIMAARFSTYQMYTYDKNKIKAEQIMNASPGKAIGVNGDVQGALQPVTQGNVKQDSIAIMNLLTTAAERATASPAIMQGATPDKTRSATELAIQQQHVDRRYSMTARLFGASEKRYWEVWRQCYKLFYKEGTDTKIMRIDGGLTNGYQQFKKADNDFMSDPDCFVESSVISEEERIRKLQGFSNFLQTVQQDPTINRRYLNREYARLNGMSEEEIYLAFPKNSDELEAEQYNEAILAGEMPEVQMMQNHMVHLEELMKLPDEGAIGEAKQKMIKRRQRAMRAVRENPQLIPAQSGIDPGNPMGNPAQAGAEPTAQATNFQFPSPVEQMTA